MEEKGVAGNAADPQYRVVNPNVSQHILQAHRRFRAAPLFCA